MRATTEAGRCFVEAAAGHIDNFRSRAAEHDRAGSFPSENFNDLKRSGLMAAFVPTELGGMGLDSVHDWAAGLARLGEGDASTAIALNMHLGVSRRMVEVWRQARAGDDPAAIAKAEDPLRAIVAGELVICATATEPGTDFLRPRTTATRVDEGWKINGRKVFVTLSPIANLFVLNLRVEDEEGDRIGFVFLPAATPGVEPQDDWDALGMCASGSQSVVLRDCVVAEGNLQIAGPWGRWTPGLLMGRTLGNLTLLGVFVGIAQAARDLAVEAATVQTKPKFDGPLGNDPGVRTRLGEIEIALATAKSALSTTAAEIDHFLDRHRGKTPSLEDAHACMRDYQCAKWAIHDNTIAAVSQAMDVAGGGAYMSTHTLSRLYRDVRAGPFMQPFSPLEAREYVGAVALGRYPEG